MNKLILVALLAVVALSAAKPKWHQLEKYDFNTFMREFQRSYSEDEIENRRYLFEGELERVKNHNKDQTKTWKETINHFSDRTEEEKKAVRGMKKSLLYSQKAESPVAESLERIDVSQLPPNVDWRTKGILTAVKDQGMCGSCWTFATAETLEAYWALATGQVGDLSEQQILDCTPNPDQCGGTGGCGGGTVELAYSQIMQTGGLSSEWTYSYQSYNPQNFTCRLPGAFAAKISNYTVLPSNQLEPMLQHIATVGPLAVSVDASAWSAYSEGVFNGCNQTNPDLDHAVQLVGYGEDAQLGNYWIIRNSWSPAWGEEGFIRIARPDTVQCGVDIHPKDGDACKDSPPTQTVCGTCGVLFDSVFPIVPSM